MIIRKFILFILFSFVLAGGSFFSLHAQQSEVQEYNVKAAFLYRFTDYVEGNSNGEDVFNISVLGNSNILDPLKAIANDKKIKNKRINVRQYNNIDDVAASSCQLLFISKNYTPSIESVVAKLYDKPTLIITEQDGGCAKGAHINFFTAENKLKFEVNLRTARRSGLKISSQLLQHAYIYN
jgi:hypothetical protein